MQHEEQDYSVSKNGKAYHVSLRAWPSTFGTHTWNVVTLNNGVGYGGWCNGLPAAQIAAENCIANGGVPPKVQFAPYAVDDSRFDDHYLIEAPIESGFVFRRDSDGVHTNVPHYVVHHSPRGYEWGYGGSGPSDLALNMLHAVLLHEGHQGEASGKLWDGHQCFELAYRLHQDFKWKAIAALPRNPGTLRIEYSKVADWVKERMALELDSRDLAADDAK